MTEKTRLYPTPKEASMKESTYDETVYEEQPPKRRPRYMDRGEEDIYMKTDEGHDYKDREEYIEQPKDRYGKQRPDYYPDDNLDLPKGGLHGYLRAYALDTDRDPNRVLERPRPWYIVCEWGISGTVVPAFGGTWHVTGFAESIGPSQPGVESEVKLFEKNLEVNTVDPAKRRDYQLVITVPPSAIPQDGAFKVVVLLNHSNKGADKNDKQFFTRLAGIVEIPMLQFYTAD